MQYAIELYFDKETEERLYALSKRAAEEKLSEKFLQWKTRPHLTLACFNDVDEEACARKLEAFSKAHGPLPAHLASVGMFPDTKCVFASPVMTEGMYAFQRELHACLKDFDTRGWEWYTPDRWAPHCTLALTKDDAEDVFYLVSCLMLREFRKLSGRFVAVGLVKITFPVQEIVAFDLLG